MTTIGLTKKGSWQEMEDQAVETRKMVISSDNPGMLASTYKVV